MADRIQVEVGKLRTAAGKTEDVHDRILAVLSTLQGAMDAKGPVWGNDSVGQQFAGDGSSQGYLASEKNLFKGAGEIATTMDSFSRAQTKTADEFVKMDEQNAGAY